METLPRTRAVETAIGNLGTIPWGRWTALTLVAIVGSLVYGASLALVIPGWKLLLAALWMALSAGLAWCLLIPALCWVGKLPIRVCVDACLVTMAMGEIVLVAGATMNAGLWWNDAMVHVSVLNGSVVALSNVVMATVLARRLGVHGVPARTTWIAWVLVLNGSGAIFFAIFFRYLHGA